jgi:hypothetical protein
MEKVVTFFKNLTTIFYFKFLELKKAFLERSKFERLKFELELNFTATRYSSPPGPHVSVAPSHPSIPMSCTARPGTAAPGSCSRSGPRSTALPRARLVEPPSPIDSVSTPPLLHTVTVALKSDVIASLSPLRWFSLKKVCKNRTTPHPPTSHPL